MLSNMPHINWSFIIPNVVLLLAYISIVAERIPKVATALLGACLLIVTHNISQDQAIAAIDFNVIFLLVGMMIIVNVLGHSGGLNALAIFVAKILKGDKIKLLLIFSLMTAVLSAIFDNVTTVLLLGSVTCVIAQHLKVSPVPFLISETICSNIGGTATLIGDPPNIMIGSAARLSFNDFVLNLAPPVIMILPVTLLTLFLIYRKQLNGSQVSSEELDDMSASEAITDRRLLLVSLVITFFVISGFVFHGSLNLEAGTIALSGAALLLIFENRKSIWSDVEWTTIFFFIGLFIIVGAVEKSGTIELMAHKFMEITSDNTHLMPLAILWISGLLSAIIDNIPYTATMIPLVRTVQEHIQIHNSQSLWWALALGSCLGGNGSLIGATANVVVADMAHSRGMPLSFLEFTLVGGLVMLESLFIASAYIWFRFS